jgi:hypothetical protein
LPGDDGREWCEQSPFWFYEKKEAYKFLYVNYIVDMSMRVAYMQLTCAGTHAALTFPCPFFLPVHFFPVQGAAG